MDKALADAARKLAADNIFETARRSEADKGYLQKHIAVVAEYLTESQKEELRKKGFAV